MESNEVEAITNNVLGTRNVVEAAVATGVERFLMISTDKAVNQTVGEGERVRAGEGERVRDGEGERVRAGEGEQRHSSASQPLSLSASQLLNLTIPEAVQLAEGAGRGDR